MTPSILPTSSRTDEAQWPQVIPLTVTVMVLLIRLTFDVDDNSGSNYTPVGYIVNWALPHRNTQRIPPPTA
ncbi:protein of unknown function [Nocardia cyriacigeorgica GUH-2]|uniref:Uncharacterized protein n=1 Tax=Nocardia cyriacigeorgica (strain GUH-2) TaxID=1127134 RepID=H6R767_NOCCG|nr:protein of unknown function [Nocardia cyriacigeorgica GUH-2]